MNSARKESNSQNNKVRISLHLQLLSVSLSSREFPKHYQPPNTYQSFHVRFPRIIPDIILKHSNTKHTKKMLWNNGLSSLSTMQMMCSQRNQPKTSQSSGQKQEGTLTEGMLYGGEANTGHIYHSSHLPESQYSFLVIVTWSQISHYTEQQGIYHHLIRVGP